MAVLGVVGSVSATPDRALLMQSIAIQMGAMSCYKLVLKILLSAERRAILLQKYRDRNGRCVALLLKEYRGQGSN